MKRKQAAYLLDDIRVIVADASRPAEVSLAAIRAALENAGLKPLEPCGGEAHSNPFIDNCMRCAPRWGFVGPREPVT